MRKRKGFTLVELLIVIMIIGILAGMMMLSSGAGKESAEAAQIVSDLRHMKTAVIFAFVDSGDEIGRTFDNINDMYGAQGPFGNWAASIRNLTGAIKAVAGKYLDDSTILNSDKVSVVLGQSGACWIQYNIQDATAGVKQKLAGRAATEKLYGISDTTRPYIGGDNVYIKVS